MQILSQHRTPGLSCFAGQKCSCRNQIQPFVSLLQGSRGPRGHDGPPGSPGARVRAAHLEDIRKSLNVLSKKGWRPRTGPCGTPSLEKHHAVWKTWLVCVDVFGGGTSV